MAKPARETVEMIDGRTYASTDNWQTATVATRGGRPRPLAGKALELARFLAISQSSWRGDAS
jgi:hypothetical protein